jgi:hypothetical protein
MSDNILKKIIVHSQQAINKMIKPSTENISATEIKTEDNIIKKIIEHSQNVLNRFVSKPVQNNIEFVLKGELVPGRNYFQIIGLFEEKTDDGYLKFNDNGLISTYLENSPEVAFIQEYNSTQNYKPSQNQKLDIEEQTTGNYNNTQYLGGDIDKQNVLSSIIRHSQNIVHKLLNLNTKNDNDLKTPLISSSSLENEEQSEQASSESNAVQVSRNMMQDIIMNSQKIISKMLVSSNTTAPYTDYFQKGLLYKYNVGKFIQEENNKIQFVRDDTTPLELVVPYNTRFQDVSDGNPQIPSAEYQPVYPEDSTPQYIESPPNQPECSSTDFT